MDDHPNDFGLLLKQLRGRAGLTQESLAERADLSAQTITKLERGVYRTPHIDTVHLLARALQLSAKEHEDLMRAGQQPTRPREIHAYLPTSETAHLSTVIQALSELHARQAAILDVLAPLHARVDTSVDVPTAR